MTFGPRRTDDIVERALVGFDARRAFGHGAIDKPVLVDDAGEIHLGDGLDNAGTADPGDTGLCDGLFESRLIRPQIDTDHFVARFEGLRVDADALDGAGGGTLSR